MNEFTNRYDFVLFFDVQDGNPNGDPDAGNMPRMDAETAIGLVTDVCIKRKIRNYIQLTQIDNNDHGTGTNVPKKGYDIYIKEKTVLGRAHVDAFKEMGIDLGEEIKKPIPGNLADKFREYDLPEDLSIENDEDDKSYLVIASDADQKSIKEHLKDRPKDDLVKKFIIDTLKDSKTRKPTSQEVEKGRKLMCKKYFDIRTFGAVMSLKSAPNCGQVRGPVQLTFSRSVEPIVALEHSITRMAVATEAEAEKQKGDNRTMGRKYTVPYGLYRCHGFISAHLAAQTGFSTEDLDLLWRALLDMFEHDHSAARGHMSTRKLIIFEHATALGNKPAHELFARVTCKRCSDDGPARDFSDYQITLDGKPVDGILKKVAVS